MSDRSSLRKEIDDLKHKKVEAQRRNRTAAAKYRTARDDPNTHNEPEKAGDEYGHGFSQNVPEDPLDWTAEQWAKHDKPYLSKHQSPGYRNMTSLAHATYMKETAKRTVDMDKYERSKAEVGTNLPIPGIYANTPAPEDVDAVVKSLQEASERKQKRRTDNVADKQYVNEKNRQFNMKLDREYGK
ncbi:hypothetical protein OXX80_002707 [Metschnikowia pulcherrima]